VARHSSTITHKLCEHKSLASTRMFVNNWDHRVAVVSGSFESISHLLARYSLAHARIQINFLLFLIKFQMLVLSRSLFRSDSSLNLIQQVPFRDEVWSSRCCTFSSSNFWDWLKYSLKLKISFVKSHASHANLHCTFIKSTANFEGFSGVCF